MEFIPAKKAIRRPKKKTKQKPKRHVCSVPWAGSSSFFFAGPFFNLLPPTAFQDSLLHTSLSCIPYKLPEIIKAAFTPYKPFASNQFVFPLKISKGNPFSEPFHIERQKAVLFTQRIRWTFRRFVHLWRFHRLSRPLLNDIVTGEVPKRPVFIVSWKSRTATPFEATTLHKDITERLQLHDGFFEDPQLPRNPLTNLPLTQAQHISIWNSISCAGIPVSAAFTEFRRVRWNLERFMQEYTISLQLRAFQVTMKDRSHEDTQERALDFIQFAYDQEAIDCSVVSFKYAFRRFTNHPLLVKWCKLCEEYYSAAILYHRSPQKCNQLQSSVLDKTNDLLHRQVELTNLRNADLKIQRDQARANRYQIEAVFTVSILES